MMETNNFLVKIGFKILVLFVLTNPKLLCHQYCFISTILCLSSFIVKSLIPVPKGQKIFSPDFPLQNTTVQMMLPPGTAGLINLAYT